MLEIVQPVFLDGTDVIALKVLIRSLPGWGGSLEDASVILIAQRDRCPVWTMNYRDFGTIQGLEFWTPD
ncbi:MAG: type II toxin-antitoxin system VapC family toxin [Phormidesmis sp. CAN_BIN44]|nr:type II toxin-antitoxin system VapC family toxin [Phormidesmis sp. CAN_BIN44]